MLLAKNTFLSLLITVGLAACQSVDDVTTEDISSDTSEIVYSDPGNAIAYNMVGVWAGWQCDDSPSLRNWARVFIDAADLEGTDTAYADYLYPSWNLTCESELSITSHRMVFTTFVSDWDDQTLTARCVDGAVTMKYNSTFDFLDYTWTDPTGGPGCTGKMQRMSY